MSKKRPTLIKRVNTYKDGVEIIQLYNHPYWKGLRYNGKMILKPIYATIEYEYEGYAGIQNTDGKWSIMHIKSGAFIIPWQDDYCYGSEEEVRDALNARLLELKKIKFIESL